MNLRCLVKSGNTWLINEWQMMIMIMDPGSSNFVIKVGCFGDLTGYLLKNFRIGS